VTLIEREDYPNRRIYLSVDSVGVNLLPVDIYREHRERRRLNASGERLFLPMVSAFGNQQIGSGKRTPRFTDLASGVKIIPYDTTHIVPVRGALISTADELEGPDLFDRAGLVSVVDIDYQPPQVEIITVPTGGGLSAEDRAMLLALYRLRGLDVNATITRTKNGNTTTETDGAITITHDVNPTTETVTTRRTS